MINISQNKNIDLIGTKKTVDWLVNNTIVSVFNPINFTGYQRQIDNNHCKKIVEYLESIGRLYITYKEVENYYYRYSDSVCCGWRIVDDDSLPQFAEYLANVELRPGGYKYIDAYDYDEEDD